MVEILLLPLALLLLFLCVQEFLEFFEKLILWGIIKQ